MDGCDAKFSSATERRQHLIDLHAFPTDFSLERMHVRQRHKQRRPDKAFQHFTRGRGSSQRYRQQNADRMQQLSTGMDSLSMS